MAFFNIDFCALTRPSGVSTPNSSISRIASPLDSENYRVAVFSHLLVPLARNCRGGDQDTKLTVSQSRNQARNLSDAYGIRLGSADPRRVALGLQSEVHINGVIVQAQDVAADCIATAIDRGPRDLIDDHASVVRLEDARGKPFELVR